MKSLTLALVMLVPTLAQARYVQVKRTLRNMQATDMSSCQASFRTLHSNWMECKLKLANQTDSPIEQITAAWYPSASKTWDVPNTNLQFSLNVDFANTTTDGYNQRTAFRVTARYEDKVTRHLVVAPAELMTFKVLKSHLKQLFAETDANGTFVSRPMIVKELKPQAGVQEEKLGTVYVGKKTHVFDLNSCMTNYRVEEVDQWPAEPANYWVSSCSYSQGTSRSLSFVEWDMNSFVGPKLTRQMRSTAEVLLGSELKVVFTFAGAIMRIEFKNTSPDLWDMQMPANEAVSHLENAMNLARRFHSLFLTIDPKPLDKNEQILGLLVDNNGKLEFSSAE